MFPVGSPDILGNKGRVKRSANSASDGTSPFGILDIDANTV
jgi:hypothetical protein